MLHPLWKPDVEHTDPEHAGWAPDEGRPATLSRPSRHARIAPYVVVKARESFIPPTLFLLQLALAGQTLN